MTNSTPNLTRLRELEKKVANLQTAVLLLCDGGDTIATILEQIADKFEKHDRAKAELAETHKVVDEWMASLKSIVEKK